MQEGNKRQKAIDGRLVLIKNQVFNLMKGEKDPKKLLELGAINNTVFDLFLLRSYFGSEPDKEISKVPALGKRKRSVEPIDSDSDNDEEEEEAPTAKPVTHNSIFSQENMKAIEAVFAVTPYPTPDTLSELAKRFESDGISLKQIKNKFGNLRSQRKIKR